MSRWERQNNRAGTRQVENEDNAGQRVRRQAAFWQPRTAHQAIGSRSQSKPDFASCTNSHQHMTAWRDRMKKRSAVSADWHECIQLNCNKQDTR